MVGFLEASFGLFLTRIPKVNHKKKKKLMALLVTSFEWLVSLEIPNKSRKGANSSSYKNEETCHTDYLKPYPPACPGCNLLLRNVHLNGEENCKWPESKGS